MAEIVVGIASSHSPQLSSGVDMWPDHAARDQRNPQLLGKDAVYHSYSELLDAADAAAVGPQLEPDVWESKYARCQDAIEQLAQRLAKAQVDVAIVIGDDQREIYQDEGIPAFAVYAGDELVDLPPEPERLETMPPGIRAALWARSAGHPQAHPADPGLGLLLADKLGAAGFDLTVTRTQPQGRSLGHAFSFAWYRLGLPATTPIAPVFVNTYYPPNVPSAARCYALGQAVARAVQDWESDARVAVIASGGLSHFVIDEELDQRVLTGLTQRDAASLSSLPAAALQSGNSEILNWVAAAGALEHLSASVVDYVPGYRTPAATGTGMAFAYWD